MQIGFDVFTHRPMMPTGQRAARVVCRLDITAVDKTYVSNYPAVLLPHSSDGVVKVMSMNEQIETL